MTQFNHVERVTIRVEMGNGDVIEMHEQKPSPSGGNPRFMWQQLDNGVQNVAARVGMAISGSYGKQETPRRMVNEAPVGLR